MLRHPACAAGGTSDCRRPDSASRVQDDDRVHGHELCHLDPAPAALQADDAVLGDAERARPARSHPDAAPAAIPHHQRQAATVGHGPASKVTVKAARRGAARNASPNPIFTPA